MIWPVSIWLKYALETFRSEASSTSRKRHLGGFTQVPQVLAQGAAFGRGRRTLHAHGNPPPSRLKIHSLCLENQAAADARKINVLEISRTRLRSGGRMTLTQKGEDIIEWLEKTKQGRDERLDLSIDVDGSEIRAGHGGERPEVLEAAGKLPPDDYIVYWLGRDNILEDLGLDRTVHIHERGVERFLTFQADRSFRFEIDGKGGRLGLPDDHRGDAAQTRLADGKFRVGWS